MTAKERQQIRNLYYDCYGNDQTFAEQIKIASLYARFGMAEIWKVLEERPY